MVDHTAPADERLDALEVRCLAVFDQLEEQRALRRVPRAKLDDESHEIARRLLGWEARWRRWQLGQAPAPIPWGLLRESDLVSKLVKEIECTEKRRITNYDARLRAAIKEQRARAETAEEMFRRAKKRANGSLGTLCKADIRRDAERGKHATLIRELNHRRVIDSEVSGRRALPPAYALGPLLAGLFRCGVPDRGIARLLRLVQLPRLSSRQIKRIRSRS